MPEHQRHDPPPQSRAPAGAGNAVGAIPDPISPHISPTMRLRFRKVASGSSHVDLMSAIGYNGGDNDILSATLGGTLTAK